MNAESCPKHAKYIDAVGTDGIYYPWVCPCPDIEYEEQTHIVDGVTYLCYENDHYCPENSEVDFDSDRAYDGSMLVQCSDCTAILPLLGFMRTPQDMGECPMCGGPVENV